MLHYPDILCSLRHALLSCLDQVLAKGDSHLRGETRSLVVQRKDYRLRPHCWLLSIQLRQIVLLSLLVSLVTVVFLAEELLECCTVHSSLSHAVVKNSDSIQITASCTGNSKSPQAMVTSEYRPLFRNLRLLGPLYIGVQMNVNGLGKHFVAVTHLRRYCCIVDRLCLCVVNFDCGSMTIAANILRTKAWRFGGTCRAARQKYIVRSRSTVSNVKHVVTIRDRPQE